MGRKPSFWGRRGVFPIYGVPRQLRFAAPWNNVPTLGRLMLSVRRPRPHSACLAYYTRGVRVVEQAPSQLTLVRPNPLRDFVKAPSSTKFGGSPTDFSHLIGRGRKKDSKEGKNKYLNLGLPIGNYFIVVLILTTFITVIFMGKKLLIETTAGNTIVDDDSIVGSYVSGKNVFVKPAKEVNIGEKVFFEKQFIYKTLSDIEKDLLSSPRYGAARNSLYVKNEGEKEQTAISYILNNTHLLKGLNENEKINKLYEVMGKKVTKQTMKNWLSGETVMPEFENLGFILTVFPELDPIPSNDETEARLHIYRESMLNDFYDGFKRKKEDGLAYPLYDLYMNIRRGIMRYVAEPKGKGEGEKKERKMPLESVSLTPEIDIVVKKYFDDVSDKIISARVTDIKEIEREKALKVPQENYEKLRKGIVKLTPAKKQEFLSENGLNEVSIIDLLNDFSSLEYVIGKYVTKLSFKYPVSYGGSPVSLGNEESGLATVSEKIRMCISPLIRPLYVYSGTERPFSKEAIEQDKRIVEDVKTIYSQLEQSMNINEFNLMEKLIESINIVGSGLPSKYFKWRQNEIDMYSFFASQVVGGKSLNDITKTKKYNEFAAIDAKMEMEFKKEYGLDFSKSPIKSFKGNVESKKENMRITDEDGKAFLKKYGLSDLIPPIFGENA